MLGHFFALLLESWYTEELPLTPVPPRFAQGRGLFYLTTCNCLTSPVGASVVYAAELVKYM